MLSPVNGGISGVEPGESEDDIFSSATHDIEEVFLGNPFNICVKGASIVNYTSFVCSLVHITNHNGEGEFFGGESVFSNELPVNARDICTRIYQCGGVDDFESV